ncbi:uncharacterized protein J8A68_000923 [[Candida] subhashii]|uniref:PH-response regulator protein palI/RIM9 n=1 Tax=[Candida] subhashii TaxID=561895 RepID=A0A8J5URF6_9ASCO|nr:uncharacterized protein J8A68_000923 [[Candida] subhashii]KAG7665521.1 hypothetical protein J8A68_000923 [[Candida] subhashii]
MGFKISFNSVSFIVILVSFVFLLLATISTPIVNTFSLAKTASHTYGLFGYCDDNNNCSGATYPIILSAVSDRTTNWIFDGSKRDTLAKIFIITPIALGFNFILFVLIIATHFGSRSVCLIAIVINLLSLVLTIVSTIITILTFYPNMSWTGWLLVGSAAANIVSIAFLLLSLRVMSDDDDDDLESLTQLANSTPFADNTEKFNARFPSTNAHEATSSLEKDYDYRGYTTTMRHPTGSSGSTSAYGNAPAPVASTSLLNTRPYQAFAESNAKYSKSSDALISAAAAAAAPISAGMGPGRTDSFTSNYSNATPNAFQYSGKVTPPRNFDDPPTGDSNLPQPEFQYNNSHPNQPPIPYPVNQNTNHTGPNPYQNNHDDMFEFGPQTTSDPSHKLYRELDDDFDDEEDLNARQFRGGAGTSQDNMMNEEISDNDSDFTSVSQRAPNPQYVDNSGYYQQQQYAPHQQQPHMQQPPHEYGPVQPGYVPQSGPGPAPVGGYNMQPVQGGSSLIPPRPSVSEAALSNNPDFSIGGRFGAANKRKVAPGFVPVAARYNNGPRPGGAPGSGRPGGAAGGAYGMR